MTLFSMTGYGEGRSTSGTLEVVVEVKTVNHRFLDLVLKLPSAYSKLESEISKVVRDRLKRGRVEIFVGRRETGSLQHEVKLNEGLFSAYLAAVKQALEKSGSCPDTVLGEAVLQILNKHEVLDASAPENDLEAESALLFQALNQAIDQLVVMRAREGEELEQHLRQELQTLKTIVQQIGEKAQSTPVDFRQKLLQRLEKLNGGVEVSEDRLAQEVAILADRIDITEELARLGSHFLQFDEVITNQQGGRKLDFLLQEMTREINTSGSKSQNSEITALVVEAKAVVEKLKEQVQNVE